MVTPFAPSSGWMRSYLRAVRRGAGDKEARREANRESGTKGKDFARTIINGPTGKGFLGVPVEGGAGQLKRVGAFPALSEHGKWRREHLGALNAAYGRCPYYQHLMPGIERIYLESEGLGLEEFNSALLGLALGWLDYGALPEEPEDRFGGIIEEHRRGIDFEACVLELLFKQGPSALWGLL